MAEGEVTYEVRADTSKVKGDMDDAEKSIKGATSGASGAFSKLGSVAGGVFNVLGKAALGLGTAAVGMGTAVTKVGMEWESAFAGVRKTVDMTEEEFGQLEVALLDMSKNIPITATEIAGITEVAGQLGIKNEALEGFTRTMADLGVATNLSSEQAATALARLANITQMPQENFDRLGSTVVDLGNKFATTESEIVTMSTRLGAAANQSGFTEAQILALSTALSSVGIKAQAGGGAMTRVLNTIAKAAAGGADEVQGFADVAGLSAEEFQQMWGEEAAGAFDLFVQGLGRVTEEGGNVAVVLDDLGIKETQATQALTGLAGAGSLFSDTLSVANNAWEENTALTDEATERYNTLESQFQIFKNTITAIGIALFEYLEEPLRNALMAITEMFQTLEESGALEEFGEALGAFASILSETLVNILPIVIDLFNSLVPVLVQIMNDIMPVLTETFEMVLPPLIQLVEAVLPVLMELFASLIPPLAELITAILPVLVTLFQELLPPILQLIDMVLPILTDLLAGVMPLFTTLIELLGPIIELFVTLLQPILTLIGTALKPLMTLVTTLIDIALRPLIEILKVVSSVFKSVFDTVSEIVSGTIKSVINIFKGLIDFIKNVFTGNWKGAWEAISNIFKTIADALGNIFKAPINFIIGIINGFISGINSIKIPDWVPGIGGAGFNIPTIPKLRIGLDEVPMDDYPAILHKKEAVLTAAEADIWRGVGGVSGIKEMLYNATKPQKATSQQPIEITTVVELDGREVARGTAPYMAEQLAFDE